MATSRNNGVKNKQPEDVGFGLQGRTGYQRLINKDGRFNVQRQAGRFFHIYDLYIRLIRMPWLKFSGMIVWFYFTLNMLFALAYWFIGVDELTNINTSTPFMAFMDAFFFSAQTLTTVGYGRIAPLGLLASSVAALESLTGVLIFALATGLLYGRFSRPVANLLYSKHMLVTPHNGGRALMFRIANRSQNQLLEGEMVVTAAYQEPEQNGPILHYISLELEVKKIQYVSLNWTLVHMMNEKSPMYNWTKEDFERHNIEFLITFKATDDTFMQTVHDRSSYKYNEIIWGAKFVRMFGPSEEGGTLMHMDLIDTYEPAEMPVGEQA